jgi:hypothetical protein
MDETTPMFGEPVGIELFYDELEKYRCHHRTCWERAEWCYMTGIIIHSYWCDRHKHKLMRDWPKLPGRFELLKEFLKPKVGFVNIIFNPEDAGVYSIPVEDTRG